MLGNFFVSTELIYLQSRQSLLQRSPMCVVPQSIGLKGTSREVQIVPFLAPGQNESHLSDFLLVFVLALLKIIIFFFTLHKSNMFIFPIHRL